MKTIRTIWFSAMILGLIGIVLGIAFMINGLIWRSGAFTLILMSLSFLAELIGRIKERICARR